jgi:Ca2+-binding RTX toxin-like protein
VSAQNDRPSATGLPTDVTVTEDVASILDLSAVTITDWDTGAITVVLTASAGALTATTGGGVTVTGSGTGSLTLRGTASAIDTFFNTASNIRYTGAANANGDNAATLTITADDGTGTVALGTVNIDIVRLGTDGPDTMVGGSGNDLLNGLGGNDVIDGREGDDVIDGGYGDDQIFAGAGNDTVVGGVGHNVIDGGAGWDIVTVSGPSSAYRLLADGDNFILKGPDGGDRLTNVEAIRFADGKVLDLARMYGPDVDASAWADGRIPEELLSGEGPRPLVWVQETTEKDVMPEVLPAADDAGLDRFGEPGPLIGVFGGGSDPSIPLTLDGDSEDFLTTVGGTNGGDLLTGDTGDRVDVAVVARPQFGGDRVVPGLMNGRERELRVESDGRMPEPVLPDEKAGGDRPLVLPGADDAEPLTVKDGGRPEVLPGADDGDYWILKDVGEPLVLPGAAPDEVLIAKDGGGPEVLPAVDDVVGGAKAFDGPEVLPAAPVDKFLVEAEVLPPLPSDYFSAEVPEVLPALDDGFLVTGKLDDLPPVMPTLPDEMEGWDVAAVIRPSSETLALILEGAEHPYGQSLTLLDERPTAPSKSDAWE